MVILFWLTSDLFVFVNFWKNKKIFFACHYLKRTTFLTTLKKVHFNKIKYFVKDSHIKE